MFGQLVKYYYCQHAAKLVTPTSLATGCKIRCSVTLDFLARFLSKVADQEKKNRMNAKGLAVVLSPNLLRNPEGDPLIFKVNYSPDTGKGVCAFLLRPVGRVILGLAP